MGQLDDAIREHLELKRRHGGDESEIRRLEQEAFGPVRSPGVPAEEPVAAEPPLPGEAAAALPDEPADEPAHEPADEPASEPEPQAAAPTATGFTGDEPWLDEPDEVPAGDALDHRGHGTAEPTREFTPGETAEARGETPEEPGTGEDLLEETPEFLQETPEHDRLWFEQKPPRDFDF